MPGYIIHIAIGKQYAQKNKITDLNDFIKGIIMPDLLDKRTSHYGNDSSCPNLKRFLAEKLKPAKICKFIDAVSDLDLSQLSCLNNFYIKEETDTTR